MSTLKRRLTRIERFLTENIGLVPHSRAWTDYGTAELNRKLTGDPTWAQAQPNGDSTYDDEV